MSPSKILIPVDGSPASLRAVDFAIEMLARNSGNSLVLRQGSKPVDPVPFLARL
jgi:nucleotide-binding universal stress UspA family protein